MKLIKDKRYKVQYLPLGSKKPHELVGQYMGAEKKPVSTPEHWFSLRPAAGTTMILETQIISTQLTDQVPKAPRKL